MRILRFAAASAAALLIATNAFAADNLVVKDGSGTSVTVKTKDVGSGVEESQVSPSDALGVPFGYSAWGVAPTGNVPGVNAYVLNTNANGQTTMSASSPVTLASDQKVADPCTFQAKTKVAFSTTTGSTQLVALSGSTKIYVCAIHFVTTSADSISFVEGTGTACATGATAVSGSTTAASGLDYPANGGMTEGSGIGTVMATSVAGDALCLLQSGTTKIAGNLMVVQQ